MFPVNGSLRMAPLFPRSGPGESGSPMSQVLLRCYDFPPRISGHLFASLPGSTRSSSVRVSQLALPEGRRASGPGHLFNRRPNLPVCLHVDVSGTSQVPRRSIPCLCPALRPRPNRRSLASLPDTLVSHWGLYALGYRPNPGLKSTPLYVLEALFIALTFWKGLSLAPCAAWTGVALG